MIVAAIGWSAGVAILAGLAFAGIYYLRTTPYQRRADRARTRRIESSAAWERGPVLLAASVLVLIPAMFLPTWTLWVFGPICLLLLLAGLASMIVATRRYG